MLNRNLCKANSFSVYKISLHYTIDLQRSEYKVSCVYVRKLNAEMH